MHLSPLLAALISSCAPARAADLAAPSAFETHYVPAVQRALGVDPFFASRLVQSFDFHMTAVPASSDAKAAGEYLKAQVKGVRLEDRALDDRQAGAVLAAGALAAPRQFNAALSRLEELKPGLGGKILESYREAPRSSSAQYRTAAALTKAGEALRLSPTALTYNAKGELELLFDGAKL